MLLGRTLWGTSSRVFTIDDNVQFLSLKIKIKILDREHKKVTSVSHLKQSTYTLLTDCRSPVGVFSNNVL